MKKIIITGVLVLSIGNFVVATTPIAALEVSEQQPKDSPAAMYPYYQGPFQDEGGIYWIHYTKDSCYRVYQRNIRNDNTDIVD